MIPSRLDLNLLVSLDVLLAERNVTRAAARLGLSQPAVSAQLRQLREAFDDPLLIPAARGMTPTSRAETLREPLRAVLGEIAGLVAAAGRFDPASAGQTFRIAASDAIHSTASVPLAAALCRHAPGCRLALLSLDIPLAERLAAGELDLVLMTPQTMPPGLRARPLYSERYLCVMRKAHPAVTQPLDLERFCAMRHAMVSPAGGGFRGPVDLALAALGRSREVSVSVNSFLLIPALLAGTDLIATVPARLARRWADQLVVLPPPCEVEGFSVHMGWHARAHADPAQVWLRETLLAEAGRIEEGAAMAGAG